MYHSTFHNNGMNASFVFQHFLLFSSLWHMKLDVGHWQLLPFQVADLSGLSNFEWHSQNEVADIDILVL